MARGHYSVQKIFAEWVMKNDSVLICTQFTFVSVKTHQRGSCKKNLISMEARSCYIVQAGLERVSFSSQLLECWECRRVQYASR